MPAWAFLAGKKSYLAAAAMLAYAVSGLVLGEIDANKSVEMIIEAIAIAAIRNGITQEAKK